MQTSKRLTRDALPFSYRRQKHYLSKTSGYLINHGD